MPACWQTGNTDIITHGLHEQCAYGYFMLHGWGLIAEHIGKLPCNLSGFYPVMQRCGENTV